MVISCAAFGCTNRQFKGNTIQFHRFPLKRTEVLQKWIKEVRRKNFVPSKYSFLCSEHFLDSDYQIRPGATIKLLNENAIPSVFKGFPVHLQQSLPVKRRLLQRNIPDFNTTISPLSNQTEIPCQNTATEEEISSSSKQIVKSYDKSIQCVMISPTKEELRRKIHILQKKLNRRDLKIKNFKTLIDGIKRNVPGSDEIISILENNFGGFTLNLLMHERKCKTLDKQGVRYTNTMKDFSKTLYFYSPKAYAYVRKLFTLPHPSTIRSWISSFKCEPGFLTEVFLFLKLEVKDKTWLEDCCLIFDSMSIRKQLTWEPSKGKYSGNVDFGDVESPDLASEVLVFMVVSLTKRFKCPIAFFYINKINSSLLSTLLTSAIKQLHEIGIRIWSVTCDGASANVQCFKKLGCNFDVNDIDNFNCKFTVENNLEVNVMFDACHMIKLARNALADKKIFKSEEEIVS
uniref:THAP domain-containing protein 9 n=1 Tax=Schizaphis graminum TaxID=13262 RepID=A0A2S2NZV2_SCHGA